MGNKITTTAPASGNESSCEDGHEGLLENDDGEEFSTETDKSLNPLDTLASTRSEEETLKHVSLAHHSIKETEEDNVEEENSLEGFLASTPDDKLPPVNDVIAEQTDSGAADAEEQTNDPIETSGGSENPHEAPQAGQLSDAKIADSHSIPIDDDEDETTRNLGRLQANDVEGCRDALEIGVIPNENLEQGVDVISLPIDIADGSTENIEHGVDVTSPPIDNADRSTIDDPSHSELLTPKIHPDSDDWSLSDLLLQDHQLSHRFESSLKNNQHDWSIATVTTSNVEKTEERSKVLELVTSNQMENTDMASPEAVYKELGIIEASVKKEGTHHQPPTSVESPKLNVDLSQLLLDLPMTSSKVKRLAATKKTPHEQIGFGSWLSDDESSVMPRNQRISANHKDVDDENFTPAESSGMNNKAMVEIHEKSDANTKVNNHAESTKGNSRWSFLGFKTVERHDDIKSNANIHADSETVVANNRSQESFDFDDDSEEATLEKISILDKIQAMDARQAPENSVLLSQGMDRESEGIDESANLGIDKDGEVIRLEDDDDSVAHGFLVDDAVIAKTLSIYESITEEDGILLESFRRGESEEYGNNKSSSQTGQEPSSVTQLKKSRAAPPRETSHESQALFDILDRDFSSVSARITVSIGGSGGMRRPMTAEDVKLCFAAFVNCFTPPFKSHFAQEYNYDLGNRLDHPHEDDDGQSVPSHKSVKDDTTDPECFPRPFVPAHIVNALWKDVIKCRFLDHNDVKKGFAKKIESAPDEVFTSALSFLRDTLVLLGVLDVRKIDGNVNIPKDDNETMLSTSDEFYFPMPSFGKRESVDEIISVHQDIHQEYGAYLVSVEHQNSLHRLVEKYEKRWNAVITEVCNPSSGSRNEASYAVQMLPWTTMRSNRFKDAAALLGEKKFVHGRLKALGILEGTTAQVTDAEELILRYYDKKKVLLCFDSMDPEASMLDVYERTRKAILQQITDSEEGGHASETGHASNDDPGGTVQVRQLRKLKNEIGMALHLMGVSLGSQGFVEEELSYCMEALDLKRSSVDDGDSRSVTISDTLHCIGYSHDNAGNFLQAMEYYDDALSIRKRMLGDNDLRVAETLHNKGAILCENGACDDALSCLEEALRIRILHYGENHESCADTQQWIGNVMREWGRFDEALVFFRTALQVKKSTFGVDHEEVANTLQNMAVVLDDMEKYEVSLDCYEEALRIYTLEFGRENQKVADTLQRMAIDYAITEQHELALFTFEQAIEIWEKLLINDEDSGGHFKVVESLIFSPPIDRDAVEARIGSLIECYEESVHLAATLKRGDDKSHAMIQQRLGDLYWELRDWEKAVEHFQSALRVHRALAESGVLDESEVCAILHKKGVVHLFTEELQKAKSCLESVIYRRRMLKQKDFQAEATSLYCLGVAFNHLGVHKLALVSFTEALRLWTEIYGENHVLCGYALHWIGRQETHLLQFEKALAWYRGALKTFKSNKGHVDYAAVTKTLELLGGIHEQLCDLDAALKCYKEGVRLVRWKFGDNNEFAIDMLCRSGYISVKEGCTSDAMEFFEDAISVMKACDREGDVVLCEITERLGLIQEAEGNIDGAKTTLSDAYQLWEASVGQDDLRTAVALRGLGRVLDKRGSSEAAMQCYRECLRVQELMLRPGDQSIAETLSSMGANLAESKSYDEAIKCFQQALSIQRNTYGDNSLTVASTLHSLGKGYQEIGSFDKSVVCFKEALRITKTTGEDGEWNAKVISEISFGIALSHEANNNYQVAITYFNEALKIWRDMPENDERIPIVLQKLGSVYSKAGDNAEAVNCYAEALDILGERENSDDDLELMAAVVSGLAKSYSMTGLHDGAIEMYQRHIDLLKSDPGRRESVADSLYAMGTIYARLDNYADAIMHFKDCLIVRKKCFGVDDERVGRVLVNMGVVFDKSEDLVSAKDCFSEALRINKLNANDRETAVNLKDIGRVLAKQNEARGAVEHYVEALSLTKKLLGPGDPQVAVLLYTCGATLYEKHEYSEALEFFKDALRIRRSKLGPTSAETGDTLFMIGQTLKHSDSFDEALVFLKESLTVLVEAKGSESLDVGNCNQAIGMTYVSKQDFEAAIPHLMAALPLHQKYFGDDRVEVAAIAFELADSFSNLGKWEEAMEYAVQALRIRKMRCGNQSLECAESLNQLGDIQLALLKYAEAQNCYIEAHRVYTAVHGKGHISVAECLEKIGTIYFHQDQLSNAIDNLRRALKLFTENVGGVSLQVARVLLIIGRVEANKGSPDHAIECFKQSLSVSKELGENSTVAAGLYEIGVVLESSGKKSEAMECYKETLRLTVSPKAAETRAQTFNRIGGIMAEVGDYDDALQAFNKALSAFKKLKGDSCVEVGQTLHNMAGVFEAQKVFDQSRVHFKNALTIFLDKLGQKDLAVALALNNLGINHARRKEFEEAVRLCSGALEVRKEKLGMNHLDTCDACYNIATILDEWGKKEEAMQFFSEALEAYRSTLGDEDVEVANCFKHIGILHLSKGEDDLAKRAFVEALRIYQVQEEENAGVAVVLFNLGKIYTELDEHDMALEALARCLRIRKAEGDVDQNDIAETCLQIGIVYAAKEMPNEAKKFFERALMIYDEKGRKDTLARAQVTANLAKILSVEESYDKALQMFHEATEIFKRDIGEETDEVAEALVNIGIIHNKRVDYEEALKFLTCGLKIRTNLYGHDDIRVAKTLFEIGQVMGEWGDSEEVRKLVMELQILTTKYTQTYPVRFFQAIDTYAEVIRIVKLKYGDSCKMVVESLKRLGSIYTEKNDNDAALAALLEAADIEKRLNGVDAVGVGHIFLSIAGVYDARADEDGALAAYSDALRIFKSNFGIDNVAVALSLNNIGINHARRKNYSKAISLISEALRIRRLKLGEDHLDVADSCLNIAHVLDEWGKDDQALKFYCEAMALYKTQLGDDDVEVANCHQQIGGIYMKLDDHSKATACYVESIKIYRQKKGMDNLEVALALFNLGRVYGKTAEYDKAAACFKECLRIRTAQLGVSHVEVLAVHRYIDAIERKTRR